VHPATSSYNLGFTAYGLGAAHAYALAAVYLRLGDWDLAKREAIEGNVFQQAKATSISRLEREFRLRLQTLTEEQLHLLVEEPTVARVPLALLAVFKRYRLIRDFVEHVLIEKVETMDFELRPSDYTSFIEQQEPAHPELDELSDTTSRKLRQVTLRILAEGEILTQSKPRKIAATLLCESVLSVITSDDPALLRPFLQP
jgi:hypothetical protein